MSPTSLSWNVDDFSLHCCVTKTDLQDASDPLFFDGSHNGSSLRSGLQQALAAHGTSPLILRGRRHAASHFLSVPAVLGDAVPSSPSNIATSRLRPWFAHVDPVAATSFGKTKDKVPKKKDTASEPKQLSSERMAEIGYSLGELGIPEPPPRPKLKVLPPEGPISLSKDWPKTPDDDENKDEHGVDEDGLPNGPLPDEALKAALAAKALKELNAKEHKMEGYGEIVGPKAEYVCEGYQAARKCIEEGIPDPKEGFPESTRHLKWQQAEPKPPPELEEKPVDLQTLRQEEAHDEEDVNAEDEATLEDINQYKTEGPPDKAA